MDVFAGDSLLLMDEKWQGIDAVLREKPVVKRTMEEVVATYTSRLGTVTRTVSFGPPVAIRWEIELGADPKGRNLELTVRIPAEAFGDLPATGKTHDVQRSD